jgi:hypothetical protein
MSLGRKQELVPLTGIHNRIGISITASKAKQVSGRIGDVTSERNDHLRLKDTARSLVSKDDRSLESAPSVVLVVSFLSPFLGWL